MSDEPDAPATDPSADADAAAADAAAAGRSTPDRRDVLKGGTALLAGLPLQLSAVGGARVVDEAGDRPRGVHVAYGSDPATALTVAFSGPPAASAVVQYGPAGEPRTTRSATGAVVPGQDLVAYRATLRNLAPDTEYEYVVSIDGTERGPFAVSTAPTDPDSFRVSVASDHGIADPSNPFQRPNTDDPVKVMDRAARTDPALQIVTGDISYANGYPNTWELYFETFESYFAETPLMTAVGNHEAEPVTGLRQYDERLNEAMPIDDTLGPEDTEHEQRWYDFTYGNTLFVSLSTTTDACADVSRGEEYVPIYDPRCEAGGLTYGEVQEQYLRETLEQAVADDDITWKVVCFHGPLWTDSPDHPPRIDLRERWGPILDEYGVDLVLSGDNHVYERTKPIESNAEARWGEYGTTYVVNGTGGTSHYGFTSADPADFLAGRSNEYFGVTQLDIDDDRIRVRYVTQDGSVRDDFEVVKSDERTERGVRAATQRELMAPPITDLAVAGSREDDGSVFTGGQTNRIDLAVETATVPVTIRDRIPNEWAVVGGDATGTEPAGEQYTYVLFDDFEAASGTVTYFAEVPSSVEESGRYQFGPFEATGENFETWVSVTGTASTETVEGERMETDL
jgi:hypothetical protein